ncbi:MAG: hypothetical protein JEZ06_15990 [Anaerolineaceae bacterium]|nr:hypothetical protein [Anaerolineaceae bacterium]
MTSSLDSSLQTNVQPFNRDSFKSGKQVSVIGTGRLGGKAQGLVFISDILQSGIGPEEFPEITINIPALVVICTDIFDKFMLQNELIDIAFSDQTDDRIAHAFMKAELPFEILGDLRSLITQTKSPLAIRSSSLLEDSTYEPFAGVFKTKMIPNNQFDIATRFKKLTEAIKLVFASTYFKAARDYMSATGHKLEDEKMAVIIQEVVGKRHDDRFYPELSGVARSFNFYPTGSAKQSDGVVNLALGMGKTIVDGGRCWGYSPAYPRVSPPFGSIGELLKLSQTEFWAVNMGSPPMYDPIKETEYMLLENLTAAEKDNTLRYIASTYNPQSDRLTMGVGKKGPRALTFEPLLSLERPPLNQLVEKLLALCETALNSPVEIEFAMTFDPHQFGFLQVRKMVVPSDVIDITDDQLNDVNVLAASKSTLGNGIINTIKDIVYVLPDKFEMKHTQAIALELEQINQHLVAANSPYLLIVLGRLGSSTPWLGIPVFWSQISASKVIVEATQENANVEMSQGSHFFHNLTNLGINYFSVPFAGEFSIDWDWLDQQEIVNETRFVRHIRLYEAIKVMVDGRSGRGVIHKPPGAADD